MKEKKSNNTSRIKIEKLLTWLAFLVSLGTLYIFFYQTSLMKKQQYANVLPYLSMGNTEKDGDYAFILANNGIGPAFIDEINIHYNDSVYKDMDVNDFYVKVIVKEDTLFDHRKITHSTIRRGMLISEKEERLMLRLSSEADNFKQKHKQLREWLNNKIKIEIKYSSVYKEAWKIKYPSNDIPIKIN